MNLTESQKSCLRLIAQGRTSKEIAQMTGLSPSTVDAYLKLAATRLGAENRRAAARKFLNSEQAQKLGSQPAGLPDEPVSGNEPPRRQETSRRIGWIRAAIAPPPIGGSTNDLNSSNRLLTMLRVAFLMAVAMSALTLLLMGMIRLLN